jgi:hypothetical protein
MMKHYNFYTDSGHGWLEVDLQELINLGIASAISSYSYIKRSVDGTKVYLEEDCDVAKFDKAMTKRRIDYACYHINQGMHSPIRNYLRFHEGRV